MAPVPSLWKVEDMTRNKPGTGLGEWGTRNDGPMTRDLRGSKTFKGALVRAWCYLCGSDHPYAEPCPELEGQKWYSR